MYFSVWSFNRRQNLACLFSDRHRFPSKAKIDQRILVADGFERLLKNGLRDPLPGFSGLASVVLLENPRSKLVDTGQVPFGQCRVALHARQDQYILINVGIDAMFSEFVR